MKPQNLNIDFIQTLLQAGYKISLVHRRKHAHSLFDKVTIKGKEYNQYTIKIKPKQSRRKHVKLKLHYKSYGQPYYALSINGYQYNILHESLRIAFLTWLQYHIDNPDQQIDCPFIFKAYYKKLISDLRERFSRSLPTPDSDRPF